VKRQLLRIIDANLNRSREGLRVCEEIARLGLNAQGLARDLKGMRDRVSLLARDIDIRSGGIASARDVRRDVGRSSRFRGGVRRQAVRDIFAANMQRVKESLRVLEECVKLLYPGHERAFSRLRFRTYEIEKKALQRIDRLRHH